MRIRKLLVSERAKILLYTVVASGVLWIAVERFMGTTADYASRLDIRSTPRDPDWDPENEVVNAKAPINASTAARAGAGRNASVEGVPAVAAALPAEREVRESRAEDDGEAPPERDGDEERLSVVSVERVDSDSDMREVEAVAYADDTDREEATDREEGTSREEELVSGRLTTHALDLTLAGCAVAVADADGPVAELSARPDVTIAVFYRHASVAIKGASLSSIDALIDTFRRCESGLLVAEHNPEGRTDVDDERIVERRAEELKYYLLQRRVPKERVRLPERS